MSGPETFELNKFLPYLLNQAAESASLEFQSIYKDRYGMLRTEWRVLFHLGLYGEMTATDIGMRARMHKTKISRAVQRLTDRRFVSRTTDTNDRRAERLTLTAQGQSAYRDLSSVARDYEAALQRHLSTSEAAILRTALEKLIRISAI
ncbi:MAG: MarR family winged helix-turn-helix transcriptional regulator [Pseudomonadota bacterium]